MTSHEMIDKLRKAAILIQEVGGDLNKSHERCGCGCPRCAHQVYKNPTQARAWHQIKAIPGRLRRLAETL